MKQHISVEKCPNCSEGNEEYCARNHDPVKGMKQNISSSQLNELSDKGKDKLAGWCGKKDYLIKVFQHQFDCEGKDKPKWLCDLPLLSIGQMIEFLNVDWIERERSLNSSGKWLVIWDLDDIARSKELADALWEACKEVLNK